MWTDVLDLNDFYRSTLGQMTSRLLRARLREVWPNVRGETVLGLGYATPFLRPFAEEAARTLAFMPAPQGVTRWPREGRNRTALVDEMDLPLADRSVDIMNNVAMSKLVLEQDIVVCELNQAGLASLRHASGVLLPEEYLLKRFHNWVTAELGRP